MANVYNAQLDAYSLYHQHNNASSNDVGAALPALGHALAGATGTAVSNLAIYPLDLIITRLQVQRTLRASSKEASKDEYEGVLDAASKIYNQEGGVAAFYSGVVQDTGKSIADSFLFFLFYNYLRGRRLQKHGAKATTLPAFDELAVGMLAGACSKFMTAPISNIVTRKQTAAMVSARSGSDAKELSVEQIIDQIKKEKGIQGFWSGYSASLVLTLNPSITFFLYETFKRVLLPRSKRDDPGARLTFLMAAISKAVASTITYPFSLAKARAQAGAKPPVNPNEAKNIKSEAEGAAQNKSEGQAKKAGRDAKALAEKSTVFTTILKIYKEEGPAALYEGVWGEILKGFFSHGTTMLIKEMIHKLIIQIYMVVLKALKKSPLPSPSEAAAKAQEVAGQAGEVVSDAYNQAGGAVSGAYNAAIETASNVVSGVNGTVSGALNGDKSVTEGASELYNNAKDRLGKGLEDASKTVKGSTEDIKK